MKAVFELEDLPRPIYESIIDPNYSLGIKKFIADTSVTDDGFKDYFEAKVDAVAFGELSIRDFVAEFSTLLGVEPTSDFNPLISLIFEIFTEEAYQALLEFDVNKTKDGGDPIFSKTNEPFQKEITVKELGLERDPEIVQSKLLEALNSFDLLINEKGIIASEVEKYLRGETLAKDLAPHLAAMLDRPMSYITKIVDSLNKTIFDPIKKQIAEEGVLDISDANDYLVEGASIKSQPYVAHKTIDDVAEDAEGNMSFIPKTVSYALSQQKREDVNSHLLSPGGTPSGTSLLSDDVSKEQIEKAAIAQPVSSTPEKKYVVDPYRESVD